MEDVDCYSFSLSRKSKSSKPVAPLQAEVIYGAPFPQAIFQIGLQMGGSMEVGDLERQQGRKSGGFVSSPGSATKEHGDLSKSYPCFISRKKGQTH